MKNVVPVAHLPVSIAAIFIAIGLVIPDRAATSDKAKGAQCAAIDDPVARLACFDAAFPRPPHTTAPTAAATSAATAAPKPAAAAVVADKPVAEAKEFGLSSKQRASVEAKPAEPAVEVTTAGVKTVRKLPSGYLLIGLDNDQVWQQTEIDSLVLVRPGDRVQIRQASMGSFLLVTPSHYSTRVRRLQ